jgi:predicted Zn-ribbon and HTH transcriptional regulator
MLVKEMKCGMCGTHFEAEFIDREDPHEREIHGSPLRCPRCQSSVIEEVRIIRRASRRMR